MQPEAPQRRPEALSPQVTIETSGDLFPTDSGDQNQLDFFGSCDTKSRNIIIGNKKETTSIPCENGRYKYTHLLPKNTFRSNSKKFHLTKLKAYHSSDEKKGASSWILLDLNNQRVKTVLNRQTRFETNPTGEMEPVTEFSAFGTCQDGAKITIDVTGKDRYGHQISRYDDNKTCKNSGFYFLSQIDGLAVRNMKFNIYETAQGVKISQSRGVASVNGKAPPNFQYSIPMD